MDKIETVKELVNEMLQKGFGDRYTVEYIIDSENEIKINLTGQGVSYLIGQYGKTLLALQTLIRQMYISRTGDFTDEFKIILDIDGYKSKRMDKVKEMADNAASKALSLGQEVTLPSMNSYERHFIHEHIQASYPDLKTTSTGEEPNRRVVLIPTPQV